MRPSAPPRRLASVLGRNSAAVRTRFSLRSLETKRIADESTAMNRRVGVVAPLDFAVRWAKEVLPEKTLQTAKWLMTAALALQFTGLAGIGTAQTPEARQALAPTGKLRVGLQLGSPHNVIRDSATGDMKGVAFDLGKELARRIGVPFEPVMYPSVGALLDAGKAGAWDVAFVGFSPERAKEWDFTALHLQMEFGYLVPGGSPISIMEDVDRPGIRVAVQEKSQPDVFLSRTLKNATVVRASSLAGTLDTVRSEKADAIFSIKPSLFEASSQLPGSRVLEGRLGLDPHAMAMPKGRDPAGIAYARKFVDDAKSEGLVAKAIERAGIRGAVVASVE